MSDTLLVSSNPALAHVTGLAALATIGDLQISSNHTLQDLTGLEALVAVDFLTVTSNSQLTDVQALLAAGGGSLTTAFSLNFIDNTALPTCAAEAVRDATKPIDSCIVNNLFDACTSEDDNNLPNALMVKGAVEHVRIPRATALVD